MPGPGAVIAALFLRAGGNALANRVSAAFAWPLVSALLGQIRTGTGVRWPTRRATIWLCALRRIGESSRRRCGA